MSNESKLKSILFTDRIVFRGVSIERPGMRERRRAGQLGITVVTTKQEPPKYQQLSYPALESIFLRHATTIEIGDVSGVLRGIYGETEIPDAHESMFIEGCSMRTLISDLKEYLFEDIKTVNKGIISVNLNQIWLCQ